MSYSIELTDDAIVDKHRMVYRIEGEKIVVFVLSFGDITAINNNDYS
jgi:hypothetical protein